MRLFLAALTVGAAGIGYLFVQQSTVPAAESRLTARQHLYDWQSADDTLNVVSRDPLAEQNEPPLIVRDTIANVRRGVTSTLDEFVRVNGVASENPGSADIVSQADVPGTFVDDTDEIIPFATSDSTTSVDSVEASPTRITPTPTITATDPVRADPPREVASESVADAEIAIREAGARLVPSAPTISEATLVTTAPLATKTPAKSTPTNLEEVPVRSNETSESANTLSGRTSSESVTPVKQPASAGRSKTGLLPGAKLPSQESLVDAEWKVIGKTASGMPMHSRRYGRQGTRTLIIAGLDGLDLVGTRWNDGLAEELMRRNELLHTNEILIVRAGNPEGLTKKTSANSHGVRINRNFPSRRYQFLGDGSTGAGPSSEPETKALLEVLYSFRPRRVIHLASTTGRSTVWFNRSASVIADQLHKEFKLDREPLDVELLPGSLEDFADGTLDAAVISLRLNSGTDWRQAWQNTLPVLMTAIRVQDPDSLLAVSAEPELSLTEQSGTRIPDMEEVPVVKKRRLGYEELPPPPR